MREKDEGLYGQLFSSQFHSCLYATRALRFTVPAVLSQDIRSKIRATFMHCFPPTGFTTDALFQQQLLQRSHQHPSALIMYGEVVAATSCGDQLQQTIASFSRGKWCVCTRHR